jgi:Fibronectin type III domain.
LILFATGALTAGGAASPVGGVLGDAVTTTGNGVVLTRTYSTSVINPQVPPGGGILAQATNAADASITASFWNPTNAGAGATSSYGTESTQSAMRSTGLYSAAGWDIVGQTSADYTWGMCSTAVNGGFPFLQWYATSQGLNCTVPPPPPVPVPAGAPTSVTSVGGDSSALISWAPPTSSGSFPVSNYQVVGSPSGQCLVPAAKVSCEIPGLRNGVEYSSGTA